MTFGPLQRIADSVLVEGYLLYPYRASSTKNRYRWTFGVLAPREWSEAEGCEPWWLEAQLVIEGQAPRIDGRLRFWQIAPRAAGDDGWEEGEVRSVDFTWEMAPDGAGMTMPFRVGEDLRGVLHCAVERDPSDPSLAVARIRAENLTPWTRPGAPRAEVMRAAFASTHLMLAVTGGEVASLIDPPERLREVVAGCVNTGTHPVLVGEPGQRDLVLSAPIILYDYPRIAPESQTDFCDATEIDELLALRTMTLSEAEKAEVRATDPRAAALLERVEGMTPEELGALHGAVRAYAPESGYAQGSRVRLQPGKHRTDAQDALYAGRAATVEKVMHDVGGQEYLAVILDDDPAADLNRWYGRYHYYRPDEVEPIEPGPGAGEE